MYGIEPRWLSEVEPNCISITKKHFPNAKHLGDITKINGAEIEPVDIICGGSPCQDVSLAGKQRGMCYICPQCEGEIQVEELTESADDFATCPKCKEEINKSELSLTRSGLFMDYIRIIKEMREATNNEYPKFIVFENVPGLYSSNNGDDFYTVLREFTGLFSEKFPASRPAKWAKAGRILAESGSLAWRTIDAQYWGVAQRRRRIYLVVHLDGQCSAEILFKSESLRRHTTPGNAPWKRFTDKVEKCSDNADDGGLDRLNGS
jgi:DNA (cytosine-5)-methyltransferase 1